jgi:hypothetical protein
MLEKKYPVILLFIFQFLFNDANMAQSTFSGIYELRGIHDMASGFKFDSDRTFEFYYIYGAVDRMAKGSYEIVGDTIKLKSQKTAGNDFEIKTQKKQGSGYHLEFTDPNSYLIGDIICISVQGNKKTQYESNQDGIIQIPEEKVDIIYAQHQLFPDALSVIKEEANQNNYFQLALKPSLAEVSFKGIDLFISGDELHMLPNYFMPFENIVYKKE